MTSLLDHFTVAKEVHFIYGSYNEDGQLSFKFDKFPASEQPPYETWFREVDVAKVWEHTNPRDHLICFSANMISNQIARDTRRGAGNIYFVQNKAMGELLQPILMNRTRTVIIDKYQPEDEIRCTYWTRSKIWKEKPNTERTDFDNSIVDGGIQISPDGFHCLPDFRNYFTKCKVQL